ncbi:hypothetical protein ACQY0O_001699 [Thecaphora frezii]
MAAKREYIGISTIGLDRAAARPAPLPFLGALPSYWLATSADPLGLVDGREQPLPDKADVVIIGSGITGISTAYHLARAFPKNTTITVLEARQFCSGATARNGGHLTPVSALAFAELAANPNHLDRFSEHYAAETGPNEVVAKILELEARTVRELLDIVKGSEDEVEHVAGNNWHLCFEHDEVEEFQRSLEEADAAGLQRFTRLVRRVSSLEVDTTMHDPRGVVAVYEIPGNTMHPRKLVSLLYAKTREQAAARNIHIEAFTHSPVERIEGLESSGPYRARVHVGRRAIDARYVVHATNGYASHLAKQLAGPTGVVPTRAQVVAFEPRHVADPGGEEMLWPMGISAGGGYEYGHQRPVLPRIVDDASGKLAKVRRPLFIFGGGREVAVGREWGIADDTTLNDTVSEFLHRWLPDRLPDDFERGMATQEWTGIMGFTKSKDPLVGPVPRGKDAGPDGVLAGQFMSVGYSGHGMSRAYSCAEVVASMVVAEEKGQIWSAPEWWPLCYLSALPGGVGGGSKA